MPTTERDAQALTYLARRIREETPGASKWDEPGVHAVISELVGQNLAITAERVVRHAGDPQAKTPGAIRRPFLPDAPTLRRELDVAPVRTRCTTCGARTPAECSPDHEFTKWRPRDVDVTPVVAELKDHVRPPAPADPHPTAGKDRDDMSETEAGPRETTHLGLTHMCDDPKCHVPGFVTTLRRMSAAEVDWRTLPGPTDDAAVARKRIADFCHAVHTLYTEESPEPDGLIIDSATDWSRTIDSLDLLHPQHHLLLADLETLLAALAPAPAGDSGGERG